MKPWEVTFIIVSLLIIRTNGADPVYSNASISDASGNSADANATVTWADLPTGSPYNAGEPSRVSEGLGPYYSLIHAFIRTIFPVDIPDSK